MCDIDGLSLGTFTDVIESLKALVVTTKELKDHRDRGLPIKALQAKRNEDIQRSRNDAAPWLERFVPERREDLAVFESQASNAIAGFYQKYVDPSNNNTKEVVGKLKALLPKLVSGSGYALPPTAKDSIPLRIERIALSPSSDRASITQKDSLPRPGKELFHCSKATSANKQ